MTSTQQLPTPREAQAAADTLGDLTTLHICPLGLGRATPAQLRELVAAAASA